jgi:hypothetical protein
MYSMAYDPRSAAALAHELMNRHIATANAGRTARWAERHPAPTPDAVSPAPTPSHFGKPLAGLAGALMHTWSGLFSPASTSATGNSSSV